jgi:hypothetical protein
MKHFSQKIVSCVKEREDFYVRPGNRLRPARFAPLPFLLEEIRPIGLGQPPFMI